MAVSQNKVGSKAPELNSNNFLELQFQAKVKWFNLFSSLLAMLYCGFFLSDVVTRGYGIPEPFATLTYPAVFLLLNALLAFFRRRTGNAILLMYLLPLLFSLVSTLYFLILPEKDLLLQNFNYAFKYTFPFCFAMFGFFRGGERHFSLGVVLVVLGATSFLAARSVEHTLSSYEIVGFTVLIVLACLLLPIRQGLLVVFGVISIVFGTGLLNSTFLAGLFPGYGTTTDFREMLTAFFWVAISCILILLLLSGPKREQDLLMQEQNKQLQVALEESQRRQRLAEEVNEQLLQLVAKLQFSAEQQASGSQEHLSSVNQINSSVVQLESAAYNIAELAEAVNKSVGQVADDSQQIEETTRLSVTQSKEGSVALDKILTVIHEVDALYQKLTEAMKELTGKSESMERVLGIISNISTETHLLGLNAAIEAAGAGTMGNRFRVVAQEVKRLSQNTQQASLEVVTIVKEMTGVVQEITQAISEGNERVAQLDEVTNSAGKVIERMAQITGQSRHQATLINQATQEMRLATDTISTSSEEQRLTVRQIVQALQGLSEVARQNVEGSRLVWSTSGELEQASFKLGQALFKG